MPLDRAHAHARWAERYDAQGETQRATAHFGRAAHYARMVQAFGAPKRGPWPREADLGNIGIGLWENGAEAWYTLQNQHYSEGPTAAKMRKRMQQVLRGHAPPAGPSWLGAPFAPSATGLARCALRERGQRSPGQRAPRRTRSLVYPPGRRNGHRVPGEYPGSEERRPCKGPSGHAAKYNRSPLHVRPE